jgi:hypothetical protein
MGFFDTNPNTISVISSCKTILKEWRFVVYKGEIVTGSLYHDFSKTDEPLSLPCEDEGALEYAKEMAKLYSPEDMWILDICSVRGGEYKIMEIGCFSFAGLYGCDLGKVVDVLR